LVIAYAGALLFLAADRLLDNRLLGTKLDSRLEADVQRLSSSGRPPCGELISWHEFAIPVLLKGLKSDSPVIRKNCHETLVEITGHEVKFDFAGASEWENWWNANRNDFWKKRNPPKSADDPKHQ
jgi:hypothetical protein